MKDRDSKVSGSPFTHFRFIWWYKRDVSLIKEQNFDSSRSPRTHNFVLSRGISAMCRSQKNRISTAVAHPVHTISFYQVV